MRKERRWAYWVRVTDNNVGMFPNESRPRDSNDLTKADKDSVKFIPAITILPFDLLWDDHRGQGSSSERSGLDGCHPPNMK